MKFMHLSDLHLGKRVNEFSMIEDQQYILNQIAEIADREKPDGVLIAGDVYDKSVPPTEAVQLFDDFLVDLAEQGLPVFIISGNHDSAERVAFGSRLMISSGVYLSPVYDGSVKPVTLEDGYGKIDVYLLPFLKPAHVRRFFPDEEIGSYTDAMRVAIEYLDLDLGRRNILITHQFVTGAVRSESEEISVGGADNVDASVFEAFDYVALGHLHRAQSVTRETIRYCGTPLKYSFSEADHEKSVTLVELGEKGQVSVETLPLVPLRDMHEIKGTYEEVTLKRFYEETDYQESYMHITLTDEEDIPDALGKLRAIYSNIMKLDYDNERTRTNGKLDGTDRAEQKSPIELFAELYEKQNKQPMSQVQQDFLEGIVEDIWEEQR
ncbi:MAG: exonuclease SbcCD subunit D [Emergencia timonensis]|uniref:exonuclease SbcCD subunit D n=1 Tax=Emergencia timonensis TaxID=1776384 RepID=UPI0008358E2C|nr:exonuclease SbcCD subunit D [Emergencia timonensis]